MVKIPKQLQTRYNAALTFLRSNVVTYQSVGSYFDEETDTFLPGLRYLFTCILEPNDDYNHYKGLKPQQIIQLAETGRLFTTDGWKTTIEECNLKDTESFYKWALVDPKSNFGKALSKLPPLTDRKYYRDLYYVCREARISDIPRDAELYFK